MTHDRNVKRKVILFESQKCVDLGTLSICAIIALRGMLTMVAESCKYLSATRLP